MAGAGAQRLAKSRWHQVRALRAVAGCSAALIALGLALLAGRPPAKPSPIEIFNVAEQMNDELGGAHDIQDIVASPVITLRPALRPNERPARAANRQSRNASLVVASPESEFSR